MNDIFKLQDKRFIINGLKLAERRKLCHVTQTAFATQCGWRSQYQCKLEHSESATVSEATAHVIQNTLKKLEVQAQAQRDADRKRFEDAAEKYDV